MNKPTKRGQIVGAKPKGLELSFKEFNEGVPFWKIYSSAEIFERFSNYRNASLLAKVSKYSQVKLFVALNNLVDRMVNAIGDSKDEVNQKRR